MLFILNNEKDFLAVVLQQQFRDLNDHYFCYVWLLYAKILFPWISNVMPYYRTWFRKWKSEKIQLLKKKCSNIKLANMALSKQQLAGKLAKKNLFLNEKVKFLDFAKGNSNAWMQKTCRNIQDRKNYRIKYY